LLVGEPALSITRWLVIPERLASYCFHGAAVVVVALGKIHRSLRTVGVYGFAVFLVLLILVGLPLAIAGWAFASLGMRKQLAAYVKRLSEPTGIGEQAKKGQVVH
jgi:hypothetical protein